MEQGVRYGPVQPWGTARGTAGTVPVPGAGNELHCWLAAVTAAGEVMQRLQGHC